jgi:tetratricopeptide (TPR) repeat protein
MAPLLDALARPPSRRGLLLWLLFLAACALLAGLTGLRDEDTFHLLADGRDLLRRGGPPEVERFLHPFAGAPEGLTPSWLASLAIYGSYALLGDAGPVLLAAVLLAAIVLVLAVDGRDGDATWAELAAGAVPVALAVAVLRPRAVARPEMLANVLLALTLLLVRRYEAGRARSLLAVLPVVLVWTNLHQSAVAGVAAVGIHAACAAVLLLALRGERPPGAGEPSGGASGPGALLAPPASRPGWRAAHAALVTGLALVVAGAHLGAGSPVRAAVAFVRSQVSPSPGVAGQAPDVVFDLMRRSIVELQPLGRPDWLGPFGILVALTALSFVPSLRRSSLREALTAAAFVLLAIPTRRFSATAAVVLAPIAARNLATAFRRRPAALGRARAVLPAASAAAALAVAASLVADPSIPFGTRFLAEKFPVRGAAYLRAIGFEGRLFNSFGLGGYLEWTLDRPVTVFQDGRGRLRPGDELAAFSGPSHGDAFEALDGRYRFDALVLAYPDLAPGVREILAASRRGSDWAAPRDRWALVAFDEGGLVYLRRDGRHAARAAADEYRLLLPANDFPLDRLRDAASAEALLAELRRSVREAPWCRGCRDWLGMALLQLGREDEAAWVAGERLGEVKAMLAREVAGPAAPGGDEAGRLHQLGREQVQAGRAADAVPTLRRSLALRDDEAVRIDLAYALLEARRPAEALPEIAAVVRRGAASPGAHLVHGLALESTGDLRGAAEAYREVLRVAPASGEAALARDRLGALPRDR